MARRPWGVVVCPHSASDLKTNTVELKANAAARSVAGCHDKPIATKTRNRGPETRSIWTLPPMSLSAIGYGAGDRDFSEQANILRLLVGELPDVDHSVVDQVWMLETQLDDCTGEMIAYTTEKLHAHGALDVYTTAIQMKKNRPGVLISVLCYQEHVEKLERILFRETGTLGVRRWAASRHKLTREPHTVETSLGPVAGKLARLADGTSSFAPEYESCRAVAEASGRPLPEVYQAAQTAFRNR